MHAATREVGHCAASRYWIQGLVRFSERQLPTWAFTRGARTWPMDLACRSVMHGRRSQDAWAGTDGNSSDVLVNEIGP